MSWQRLEENWRAAWKPPERYTPSQWAERNRVLPNTVSAEPGRYRLDRTPYARGIMDAAVEAGVEEIWFVAGTQIGKTTIQENILGYWIDNDPGPCLIVKPSEQAVEESVRERWRPLLETTPALAAHLSPRPHDNTLSNIKLDTMPIYFGWAGSPQSLASRPCRYVLPDECDKFPPFAGRESDPISLAKERTATYGHRRRMIAVSTPTVREGAIWRGYEGCGDKRHFEVPCPHCGTFQRLTWPQVKWPKKLAGFEGDSVDKVKLADKIERDRLAWYECIQCKGKIEDSHKPKMLERGEWVSEGQMVTPAGKVEGDRTHSKRVGFHLSSLYSPWRTFPEMAAEFIRADGDVALSMNFRNSRLAEPYELKIAATTPSAVRDKIPLAGPANVVPSWASLLIATADVQADRLYYVIRAWTYGFKSQLVRYGMALSFDELWREVFETPCLAGSAMVFPEVLMVDQQYRTPEVTEFAKRKPDRIYRAAGSPNYSGPMISPPRVEGGTILYTLNTLLTKDRLSQMIEDGKPDRWLPHATVDEDYCNQVVAEHKVFEAKARAFLWKKKSSGAANHYLDCEAMQCALATLRNMDVAPPTDVPQSPAASRSSEAFNPLNRQRRW